MAAKFNRNIFYIEVQAQMEALMKKKALQMAEDYFEEAKDEFLARYYNHPVSEEIKGGIEKQSDILGVAGSLYAFIGFEAGDDPIDELYDYFNSNIKLKKNPRYIKSRMVFQFSVNIPSNDDIEAVTPMPWGTARSWAFAIESGISGLNQYLSIQRLQEMGREKISMDASRSGGGIQVKIPLGAGGFSPQQYMSNLLNFLRKQFI